MDLASILAARRAEILNLHRNGAPGLSVSAALTDVCDRVIRQGYREATESASAGQRALLERDLAVVAVGGYGRGDLSPGSDVDLLLLHASQACKVVGQMVGDLVRRLWDAGLKVSQGVRTPAGCISFARGDLPGLTALLETRLICGNESLYVDLRRRVEGLTSSVSLKRLAERILAQREEEHHDYHVATVYLLEPNVKRSPGGLRDIHMFRWLGMARYGMAEPGQLRDQGLLDARDAEAIEEAWEFLHRLRNELHFHAGTGQDVLTRDEQVRLAEWSGFLADGLSLGVERFMQHYYRQTAAVSDVVMRFVERVGNGKTGPGLLGRLTTYRVADIFLVSRDAVRIDSSAGQEVLSQGRILVQLFDLARHHGVRVAGDAMDLARAYAQGCVVDREARRRFLECLGNPAGLGAFLRDLARVGLLGRLVPPFDRARGRIQFNLYHHYTLDEHSLLAVEKATGRAEDRDLPGEAYREIRRKDLLHLAILIHDLGKGFEEDHCQVGKRLAEELADQFGLDARERHTLVFLVHNHLRMALTAFRRDLSEVGTVLEFARGVGTAELLRMLFVLTAADIQAVSPSEWTPWKESLLSELYLRAGEALTGQAPVGHDQERASAARRRLRKELAGRFAAGWLARQVEAMPPGYLLDTDTGQIESHLCVLRDLGAGGVHVAYAYDQATGLSTYTVFAHDGLTPGIFSKVTGVLAWSGFQVAAAQIMTRSDGVIIDTFRGVDSDFAGEPPASHRQEVSRRIEQVLKGQAAVDSFRTERRESSGRRRPTGHEPVQVEIDNDSSERFTIIEIFADDRPGLLYMIARTLFACGLSVHTAKIATHIEQVVDVVYVTDGTGGKVRDASRLEEVRARLLEALR